MIAAGIEWASPSNMYALGKCIFFRHEKLCLGVVGFRYVIPSRLCCYYGVCWHEGLGAYSGDWSRKALALRHFLFRSNNILYPKEDREQKVLLYACRNCDHQVSSTLPCS
jgi:5-methylcytosine-specific restriction endonuclease McrA